MLIPSLWLAALLLAFGAGGMARRRSLAGVLAGFVVALSGGVLLATALLALTGRDPSLGVVIAMAAVSIGLAASVAALAIHFAAGRTSRAGDRLEPW